MKNEVKPWEPTNEQNIGIISSVYEFIKDELSELQELTDCPDTFPESCHALARNRKKNIK